MVAAPLDLALSFKGRMAGASDVTSERYLGFGDGMQSRTLAGPRRSQGQMVVARALWYVKPGVAELRTERLIMPQPGQARVKTLYSALSRGTERLVAFGHVPALEWNRMRAPMQAGNFPFPVKYGYSAAGTVVAGSEDWVGKRVFCLHPHQDYFHAPETMLVEVPEGVPTRRATLAANMETALNAHWDAATGPGDTVTIIGAGIVGLLTAYLARRIAGTNVTVCDSDPAKAAIAEALGLTFRAPDQLGTENRIVFNTSASGAGLQSAIRAAAFEGTVIEMSWYGDQPVTLDLGGAFHARRLKIISSQVGHVAPARRGQVSPRDRLTIALSLLNDDRLDGLLGPDLPFAECAQTVPALLAENGAGPLPLLCYPV